MSVQLAVASDADAYCPGHRAVLAAKPGRCGWELRKYDGAGSWTEAQSEAG